MKDECVIVFILLPSAFILCKETNDAENNH